MPKAKQDGAAAPSQTLAKAEAIVQVLPSKGHPAGGHPAGGHPARGKPAADPGGYTWAYIRGIVKEHWRVLVLAHILAIGASLATAFLPLLFPLLVDEVLLERPGRLLAIIDAQFPNATQGPVLYIGVVLASTLVLRLIGLVLGVWQSRLFVRISKDVTFRIRSALLGRLRGISMSEFETLGSGRVSSNLVVDLGTVELFVGSSLSRIVLSIFTVVIVSLILLWLHWPLALFILLLNPVVLLVSGLFSTWMKYLKKQENASFETFQESLREILDAIQQIRASNREGHYFELLVEEARKVKEHSIAFGWKSAAARSISTLTYLFGFDIFRAAALFMVIASDLTVGEVFAIFSYLWFMMTPVQDLIGLQYAYYGASAALARIQRLHALSLEPQYPHLENPFAGQTSVAIRIENLHFAYGRGPDVLKGIHLEIAKGERVAFVGASGGGKSTLVQALLGLYQPKSGKIYFDGVPTDRIGLDVVRDNVATVLQRPAILNDTVRSNLSLGENYSEDRIWQALEIAQVRDVVAALENGLDTSIGLKGARLSGGQLQRLAIARSILAQPRVLILDEATSAVDLETEEKLYAGLLQHFAEQTMVIIAHRLSSLRFADRVYVFEDGRVSGQGTHRELIGSHDLYGKLYGGLETP